METNGLPGLHRRGAQTPAPAHLIAGGLPTEATLAHVLVSKYADYLPLYRQSQVQARAGLDLHLAVLADHLKRSGGCGAANHPVVSLMFRVFTRCSHGDDTARPSAVCGCHVRRFWIGFDLHADHEHGFRATVEPLTSHRAA